jgi:hypothetical protein
MNNVKRLHNQVDEVLREGTKLCFLVRDTDLQQAHVEKLNLLRKEASQVKSMCINDEDSANLILALEYSLEAQLNELNMWLALKKNEAGMAWGYLVDAQSATQWAIRAHRVAETSSTNQERLMLVERLIFPPQLFLSTGMVVKEDLCSICGSIYGECDHIIGRPYNGELCFRKITKLEVQEVSLVDHPANKHCRILFIEEEGMKRDYLTWRPITGRPAQDKPISV